MKTDTILWEWKAVHYSRYTPLHIAVGRNDVDTMELLLAAKADAEATTYRGWTPLILSAMNKYREACETLRDHSVDERAKCREGKTAEDYAPEMFSEAEDAEAADAEAADAEVTLKRRREEILQAYMRDDHTHLFDCGFNYY